MSDFYDPWQHAIHLFLTRVLQFLLLSVVFGLGIWASLLHWYFDTSWLEAARWAWSTVHDTNKVWRSVIGLCILAGVLLTACLFTWLIQRSRLPGGERFHRGARVVHRDAQE